MKCTKAPMHTYSTKAQIRSDCNTTVVGPESGGLRGASCIEEKPDLSWSLRIKMQRPPDHINLSILPNSTVLSWLAKRIRNLNLDVTLFKCLLKRDMALCVSVEARMDGWGGTERGEWGAA